MQVLETVLRFVFNWIDGILAMIITAVYDLLLKISEVILYSENVVKGLGQRIGLLLGIFMLFKLATSLIGYLVSPDKLNDSSKGGVKIILNVIISLGLLATYNLIFETAYKLQIKIIDSNIIEKVFFGSTNAPTVDIGYYMYSSFFTPNPNIAPSCKDIWDLSKAFNAQTQCYNDLKMILTDNALIAINNTRTNHSFQYALLSYDLSTAKSQNQSNGKEFVFNYIPLLSTGAGVAVVLILIGFCMDIAKRAVKLLFLQLIAPIPIIMNMDTGKGKDTFQKWYKECFSTYLTVFIRLITINFAVFMIGLLKSDFANYFTKHVLLDVLLIIGCLMFAKEVPKLIEEIFGIKTGGFTLNPIKKFQDEALFGKNITGLGAAALAGGAAMGTNAFIRGKDTIGDIKSTYNAFKNGTLKEGFKQLRKTGKNTLYGAGSVLAGGLSSMSRGTIGAIRGDKFGQIYSSSYGSAVTSRNNRDNRRKLGINSFDIWQNSLQRSMGIDTTAEEQDAEIKIAQEFSQSSEKNVTLSESEIDKHANELILSKFGQGEIKDEAGNVYRPKSLAHLRELAVDQRLDASLRALFDSEYQRIRGDIATKLRETVTTTAGTKISEFTDIDGNYIKFDEATTETIKDNIENMLDIFDKNSTKTVFATTTEDKIKSGSKVHKDVNKEANRIQNSEAYRKAHKIQEQANREKK